MPTRSDSASANAPLERIKRIKDIAACRKEEVEKHGNDIRQQALERSAFRANNPNVKSTNQKPTMAEIRESKKEAFAEEFSKMGCLKCYDEGSKRVGGRTGIRKGRLDSNLEEGSKSHQSKHSAEHAPKPRWNYGTSTSKITESNHLYGYHEPFINNFKQKQVASLKDGGVNEQQSKSKPSVKNTGHRQIPVIQSLIMEDKRNNTDTALENRIPRHTSEPHMTLPSKRSAPSTKIHREKCCVFQATDIPNNDNM
ncbi:hypothetical protein LOTGIDRAFT_155201 [Lottia gigantea]|uniref:Uncharacterized protein n=1 Tax=Lottia gigantea TaxID=225164 RepID=V3Z4T5_LOTGI|nr:hypothetical protein LOTGIDRAFT_155201 [Lottia gigantea]ESO85708.1 hypothetical protein LOTGIDRAFT_155201 [Lottia gigantea]